MRPATEIKSGANFAVTCDIFEYRLIATGHRGFNDSGSDVKHWDLNKLDKPLSIFSKHQFTPESVRFLNYPSEPVTVSASKD